MCLYECTPGDVAEDTGTIEGWKQPPFLTTVIVDPCVKNNNLQNQRLSIITGSDSIDNVNSAGNLDIYNDIYTVSESWQCAILIRRKN